MRTLSRHFARTFVAGIVALLPVAGIVLGAILAEQAVADSWLAEQPWYFPGMGILGVVVATYAIGLTITTIVGRFFWKLLDRTLEALPALGMLYRTLKQVLGYGEGEDAMFERVVLVPGRDRDSMELGLVTNNLPALEGGAPRVVVFVPAAPTPTSGRVVVLEERLTQRMEMTVHEALKFLVAVGKLEGDEHLA
ncbi:MAG: DUF502 domain-containing protein [bacterium]|nr:DUF502 domain-containing protein [bacterium]